MLLLYFFDASDETVETLVRLNDAASKTSGALSVLGISRANTEGLENLAADKALHSAVLSDNKGVTLAYGLTRTLPAAVIIGPGGVVASVLAPARSGRGALMASADAFISMGLAASAMRVYQSMSDDWLGGPERTLATAYASMLMGNTDAVHQPLEDLAKGSSPFSAEAHAALGFLLYGQGKDASALVECSRAPTNGFANWVAGMVKTRAGECGAASSLFDKAAKGKFAFGWQKGLAFNMAARMAEARGDEKKTLALYKTAFALIPLNATVNANLLVHHWRLGNLPASAAYAAIIKSTGAENPLIRAVLDEFDAESAFARDSVARRQLDKKLSKPPSQKARAGSKRTGSRRTILIYDLAFTDCPPELNCLPLASAGLLKKRLESSGALVAIRRPETLEAAKRLNIPIHELQDPARLAQVARALSADLVLVGEVGTYESGYLLNLRIAEVDSGKVTAITSERFGSLDALVPALQKSAAALAQKISAR